MELILILTICLVPLLAIFLFAFLGEYRGNRKARRVFEKETKRINIENPYIYFREIPNDYGIAVSSILLDFKLEKKQDLIAEILDLCAKGYLKLVKNQERYEIVFLNKDRSNLLSSERYVLDWLLDNSKNKFSYSKWNELAMKDTLSLNLMKKRNVDFEGTHSIADGVKRPRNVVKILTLIVFIATMILYCSSCIEERITYIYRNYNWYRWFGYFSNYFCNILLYYHVCITIIKFFFYSKKRCLQY